MLSRIARNSRHTISAPFDGDPSGVVKVTVKASDGSTVVAETTATGAEYDLTPTQTASLDRLTATWEDSGGTDGEQVTTTHDVVGFHLITLEELRRLDPLADEDTYDDDALRRGRDLASYALERACNRAFAPQRRTEAIYGEGSRFLRLTAPSVSELVSIDDLDLTGISAEGGFVERIGGSWARGTAYAVTYVTGAEAVDPRVSRAVGLIAADVLYEDAPDGQGSALNPRATSQSTEDGTFSLVTAGVGANAFSLPEVNAVVQEWRLPN